MSDKTVAEIMDREPATLGPEDDVRTAVELLRQHELQGVAVVDADARLVGILTESDLILRDSDADLHLPHFMNILGGVVFVEPLKGFEQRLRKAFATSVADMMSPDPVTCSPEDDVRTAGRTIAERHHNRLPVVDDGGKLVGMVTRADVLAALIAEE